MSKSVRQPKELNDLRKEYVDKVIAWIEEQAKNPEIVEIEAELTYEEFDKKYKSYLDEVSSWGGYYSKENIEIAGRTWRPTGNMSSGSMTLTDINYE